MMFWINDSRQSVSLKGDVSFGDRWNTGTLRGREGIQQICRVSEDEDASVEILIIRKVGSFNTDIS